MAVFDRETNLRAPLERVWAFHRSIDGLVAVTPDWLHLCVEGVDQPSYEDQPSDVDQLADQSADVDQSDDSRTLHLGTEVTLSVRPFGRGPRQRWRSRIEAARLEDGTAILRDRMVSGPFDHWEHTHAMYETRRGTRLRDRVEYELARVPAGTVVDAFAVAGLAPMFRYRHRETRRLLEEGGWRGWE